MGPSGASDDRLPWLDPAPAPAGATPAARRSRAPLLILLAMLVAAAIAVMAFLAGRASAPVAPAPRDAPAVGARPPAAAPAPITPPVTPPVATPAAPPAPAAAVPRASAQPKPVRARARPVPRSDRRGMVPPIERAFPLAPVASATAPRRATVRPSRPRAPAPARGGTVQLGAYVTMPLLDAAWARLVVAYPPLGAMPRMVTGTGQPGRPYYYRLRVATASRRDARALCDRLHRIGRGCMVVARAK